LSKGLVVFCFIGSVVKALFKFINIRTKLGKLQGSARRKGQHKVYLPFSGLTGFNALCNAYVRGHIQVLYNTTAQVFFSSHSLICPGHKQTKDAPPWRTSLTLNTKHSVWNCARKAGHGYTSMARSQPHSIAQL